MKRSPRPHALGIVHRDLKPANLFIARLPGGIESVKVLDFGISKLTGFSASGGEASATKTSAMMGSPLYMSPEQMRSSKDVDTRSDIWAIGVILYELLCGSAPFLAESMPELILKIMEGSPVPLRQTRPDAPDGLEEVILHCLERDRTKRYQTVGDLALALSPFAPRKARVSIERITQVMKAAGMSASSSAVDHRPSSDSERVGTATAAAFGKTSPGSNRTKPALLVVGTLGRRRRARGARAQSRSRPRHRRCVVLGDRRPTGTARSGERGLRPPRRPPSAAPNPETAAPVAATAMSTQTPSATGTGPSNAPSVARTRAPMAVPVPAPRVRDPPP